jgi:hypothetical protein
MTRTKALDVLQLPNSATEAEINYAYQEKYSALKIQLQNTPDHLRQKFQNNLNELETAYQVLKQADLPATKPTIVAEPTDNSLQTPPSVSGGSNGNLSGRDAKKLADLEKQKTYFLIALIGLAAILSYFVVQYFTLKPLKEKADKYDKIEKSLLNKKLAIKNRGAQAYTVSCYHIWYFDTEGVLQEKERGFGANDTYAYRLEPDRTFSVSEIVGKDIVFDGKAIAYTIGLQSDDPNKGARLYSGIFTNDGETQLNPDNDFK